MGGAIGKVGAMLLDAPLHVVMIGLDGVGKTTALYRLKFSQYLNTVPTIGFNCERVKGASGKCKGASFLVWDVGGQEKLRPLWRSYTRCTDGIVFVVDATDTERMEEAKMELMRTIKAVDCPCVPVLVLANKQDLPGAKDAGYVERVLGMQELGGHQLYHVQPACAIIGEGLEEGLEQLYTMICKSKKVNKSSNKASRRSR